MLRQTRGCGGHYFAYTKNHLRGGFVMCLHYEACSEAESEVVEMAGVDPESWDFISPAAHKNTHVLGRLLEFLFAREAHKNILRSFNSRRKARRCFTPSPQNTKPPFGWLCFVEMAGVEPASELGCGCTSTVRSHFLCLERTLLDVTRQCSLDLDRISFIYLEKDK